MALSLEPVRRVRLMSLVGDFAICTGVIPSHCSGLTFEAALEQAFPRGFIMDSVGSDYVFER